MIPIYKPYLKPYKTSACKAIEDEWISNHGIYVDLATTSMKQLLGVKYCILMNNGTSTTHCLFKALKFKHPHITKLYVPNNVFIAPWNCALLEYDKTQLEVLRLDPITLNMDTSEEYIKSLDANSAVVIVHNLGNIVNVPRLKRIRPDIIFVEDNCEGLFGKYEGQYSGSSEASLCSAVSFYGNKTITTGEGGAFFTNDFEVYKFIKTYYSHGMSDVRYVHCIEGTNYRMTNVQAGFLYDQLNDIHTILQLKKTVCANYTSLLEPYVSENKIRLLVSEPNTEQSNWMFSLIIPGIVYSEFEAYMNDKNIQVRPLFYDIHVHKHLQSIKKHDETIYSHISSGCMIPSYPELSYEEQKYIACCIIEYLTMKCLITSG
jgi:perosamine synthetase